MTATHRSVARTTRRKTHWGLALLLPAAVALAEPIQPLPLEPNDSPDPRWLEQLPPVSLPLPKPQDIVSNRATEIVPAPNPDSRLSQIREPASSAESPPIGEPNSQDIAAAAAPMTEPPTEPATPQESEPSPETQTEPQNLASTGPVAETPAEPAAQPEAAPSLAAETKTQNLASTAPIAETPTEPAAQPEAAPSLAAETETQNLASTEPVAETPAEPAVESEPDAQASIIAEAVTPPETTEIENVAVPAPAPQTAPEIAAQAMPTEPMPPEEQNGPGAETGPESAAEPTPEYRWHVQLLAGRSLEKVEIDREHFIRHYGTMLKGRTLTISQSSYGDARDEFHRLRAVEWIDEAEARRWCAQLRAQGHQCLVTRVTHPDVPARGKPE
ncbi:Sporulation domain-containing protein [Thiorhodococcus drewsii AZ1]|uniref:Sporulation domain-containing protein n=1 Tax=Thiorhodococcus drewsii AZ1 TaxID=765913 RepID=G2DXE8_9GAMM|nr:SPOR domain-containing protein [Thiorhodococcus drewsii]EGV33180.1 Sporulation domain-containing protein [Thiorhodococcus drewsii AZ1]